MSSLAGDLRIAIRALTNSPGFTVIASLALALGIGANTAIFSVVNAVLLRPLPYGEPERLVELSETMQSNQQISVAYPDYIDWRAASTAFEEIGVAATFTEALTGRGAAENIRIAYASSDFLNVLRVRPLVGRSFLPEDDRPNARRVALLTHSFWQTHFAGQTSALGQSLTIGGNSYLIVGVLPSAFRYHRGGDVFVPFAFAVEPYWMQRGNHNLAYPVARLRSGNTLAQARTELAGIARRLEREYASNNGIGAAVTPLREVVAGASRRRLLILLGAVSLVLLIACVNVANLLLARSVGRQKEIATRMALGASRSRIVRQLLTESVVLAGLGGALGLALANAGMRVLAALLPGGFEASDLRVDSVVLAFTFSAALSAGVLFGIAPAVRASSVSLSESMKEGMRTGTGSAHARLRSALVVAEIALALILLVSGALLTKSLWRVLAINPGHRTSNLLTVHLDWPYVSGPADNRQENFLRSVLEKVQAVPGVRSAGGISWLAFAGDGYSSNWFYRADRPEPPQGQVPHAVYRYATPGWFQAMGVALLKGRLFREADLRLPHEVAVITDSMARRDWPGEDPIGKRFHTGLPRPNAGTVEVIGVVADSRQTALNTPPLPEYFMFGRWWGTMVMHTQGEPLALAGSVRQIVADLDRNVPVTAVRSMEQVISESVSGRRADMLLIVAFAAVAVLLAASGMYGVLSYVVSQRRREIGIRMALGASGRQVLAEVVREASLLALVGIGVGVLGGLAITRVLASMLYGVGAADPGAFAAVAAALFAVTLVASWLPARRATGVDPMVALRCE